MTTYSLHGIYGSMRDFGSSKFHEIAEAVTSLPLPPRIVAGLSVVGSKIAESKTLVASLIHNSVTQIQRVDYPTWGIIFVIFAVSHSLFEKLREKQQEGTSTTTSAKKRSDLNEISKESLSLISSYAISCISIQSLKWLAIQVPRASPYIAKVLGASEYVIALSFLATLVTTWSTHYQTSQEKLNQPAPLKQTGFLTAITAVGTIALNLLSSSHGKSLSLARHSVIAFNCLSNLLATHSLFALANLISQTIEERV